MTFEQEMNKSDAGAMSDSSTACLTDSGTYEQKSGQLLKNLREAAQKATPDDVLPKVEITFDKDKTEEKVDTDKTPPPPPIEMGSNGVALFPGGIMRERGSNTIVAFGDSTNERARVTVTAGRNGEPLVTVSGHGDQQIFDSTDPDSGFRSISFIEQDGSRHKVVLDGNGQVFAVNGSQIDRGEPEKKPEQIPNMPLAPEDQKPEQVPNMPLAPEDQKPEARKPAGNGINLDRVGEHVPPAGTDQGMPTTAAAADQPAAPAQHIELMTPIARPAEKPVTPASPAPAKTSERGAPITAPSADVPTAGAAPVDKPSAPAPAQPSERMYETNGLLIFERPIPEFIPPRETNEERISRHIMDLYTAMANGNAEQVARGMGDLAQLPQSDAVRVLGDFIYKPGNELAAPTTPEEAQLALQLYNAIRSSNREELMAIGREITPRNPGDRDRFTRILVNASTWLSRRR